MHRFCFYLCIILYVIYYLQGIIYATGSIISQTSILFFIIFGIFYFFKTILLKNNPAIIWIWIIFFIIQSLSFTLSQKEISSSMIGNISTFLQFKGIAAFSLSLFIGYYSAYKYNSFSDKQLFIIGLIFFILSITRFYYDKSLLLERYEREGITNNAAYFIVSSLTFLPIIINRHKIIGIIILFISTIILLIGLKRGAIACFTASIIFILYYYKKHLALGIKSYILIIATAICLITYTTHTFQSNSHIQKRIEKTLEGDSSGRDYLYNYLWDYWSSDSGFTYFFGNGISQTVIIAGNYAHNDWLELLINNGLFGTLIYTIFLFLLLLYIKKMTLPIHLKCSAFLCFIIWSIKTIVSMGYTDLHNVIFILLLGILIGKQQKIKLSSTKNEKNNMPY